LGLTYPSFGLKSINPIEVPLLNTLILLRSGRTVTIRHHFLLKNKDCVLSLAMTVILGIYFTSLQLIEYINSTFSISDSVYGRRFFCDNWFSWSSCYSWNFILNRLLITYFTKAYNL